MGLKKDTVKTVRTNGDLMKALEKKGWSAQKIFDFALDQLADIKTDVRIRVKKKA